MVSNKWVHCPRCGHRMFFLRNGDFDIEIKCTSCKAIVNLSTKGGEPHEKTNVLHPLYRRSADIDSLSR